MDLRAFQPPIAMTFHVESEFAVENAGFLRPDPEKYQNFFRNFSGFAETNPEFFRKIPPVMRIPMPHPMEGVDHPYPLVVLQTRQQYAKILVLVRIFGNF